jgi:hypothetical protein
MRTRTYPQRPDTHTDARTVSRSKRRAVRAAVASGALGAAAMIGTAAAAPASAATSTGISGWTQVTHYLEGTLGAGEGVATVYPPGGSSSVLYRGATSIPVGVYAEGWQHIGDPDSAQGYLFDDFQSGVSSPTSKMFRVTTPSGSSYEYVHQLVPGEEYNNSWDALSPDTQWMLAGEWDTMTHFQIYPTPILNKQTPATGGSLALSGYIQLDHAVNDVQGCDFVDATKLICASDDSSKSLFPDQKPLLEVDLPHALDGGDITGHVTDLGPIPQANSICSGTFEAEGVDYDVNTGILRVEIIQPGICEVATTVYEYKAS